MRVHASGINRTDIYARSGSRDSSPQFPLVVPHHDGAGVIDAVGDPSLRERIGERVWVYFAALDRPYGTASQFVVVPAKYAVALPSDYSFEQGACLGIPWLTAHRATTVLGDIKGRVVLVMGASGSVGFYVVQIARFRGATVVGVVRDAAGARLAAEAGAHHILTLAEGGLGPQMAATVGLRAQMVVESHLAENLSSYPGLLAYGATVAIFGTGGRDAIVPTQWALRAQVAMRFVHVFRSSAVAVRQAIRDFDRWAIAPGVRHLPIRSFPLDAIAHAHEDLARGPSGQRRVLVVD